MYVLRFIDHYGVTECYYLDERMDILNNKQITMLYLMEGMNR